MDTIKLLILINIALIEADNTVSRSSYLKVDEEPIFSTKKVLNLLKDAILITSKEIDIRILRAMHDLGMSAYKEFENTSLETAICNVTEFLYENIPIYKNLEPLRSDFGKGFPI